MKKIRIRFIITIAVFIAASTYFIYNKSWGLAIFTSFMTGVLIPTLVFAYAIIQEEDILSNDF